MTVHEQLALVSPRDGWAGWLSDDCRVVRLISPESQKGKAVDAGNYTSRFPDTAVVQADDADMVISRLADFQENSLALDFLLLLFDTQVSHETRASVAVELEKILADNACAVCPRHSVGVTAPAECGGFCRKRCRGGHPCAVSLLATILEGQDRVRFAQMLG